MFISEKKNPLLICCKIRQKNSLINWFPERFPVKLQSWGTFYFQCPAERLARKCSHLGIPGKKSPLEFLCVFASSLRCGGVCCRCLFFLKYACLLSLPDFPWSLLSLGALPFSQFKPELNVFQVNSFIGKIMFWALELSFKEWLNIFKMSTWESYIEPLLGSESVFLGKSCFETQTG